MTADGNISNTGSGSSGGPTGNELLADADGEVEKLFDVSCLPLTSVAGTNTITASFTPAETTILTGRRFALIPASTNTGAVTISLNGLAAVSVRDDDGDALAAGQLVAGRLYELYFDGTYYRIVNSSAANVTRDIQPFSTSGTWTKPANVNDDAIVIVELWAGGGGGGGDASGGGGGGGAFVRKVFRAGDLASSVAVTVGAGGAVNADGGNTTFGALLTAYGGAAGGAGAVSGGAGGAGGSAVAKGGQGADNGSDDGGGTAPDSVGAPGGDCGTTGAATDGGSAENSGGGGGGGGFGSQAAGDGGRSKHGGGGGGGGSGTGTDGTGGISEQAGNGGNAGAAGTAPAGGGGANAAGARGECRVITIG